MDNLPRVSVLFRSIADLRILIGQSIPLDGNAIGGADLLDVPLDDHIAELLVQLNSAAGAIGLLTGDQRGAGAAEGVQHQCIAHAGVHNGVGQQRDRLHGGVVAVLLGFVEHPDGRLLPPSVPLVLTLLLPAEQNRLG